MSDKIMSPNELKALLNSMKAAADVVEAIDDPSLKSRRGWDLTGWSYVLVPWGVRFTHCDFPEEIDVGIEDFPEQGANGGQHEA